MIFSTPENVCTSFVTIIYLLLVHAARQTKKVTLSVQMHAVCHRSQMFASWSECMRVCSIKNAKELQQKCAILFYRKKDAQSDQLRQFSEVMQDMSSTGDFFV
jgi:hypothetical protein